MTNIWNIIAVFIVLAITAIGIYFGLRVLKLRKMVEQLRIDRNILIEKKAEREDDLKSYSVVLDDLERRMILNALSMPLYKKVIEDPSTQHHVRKTYRELKDKIKDSIEG